MPLRHLLLHTRWPALIAHCFIAAILAALHFLQGGVHICKADEAPGLASKMLGGTLVTKQVGAVEKPPLHLLWGAGTMS